MSKKKNKSYFSSISKETKRLIFVSIFSLVLMFFLSPLYGMVWLFFSTLYLLTNDNFKKMYIIWGVFFFSWYILFILCMSDFKKEIIITHEFLGPGFKDLDESMRIINYMHRRFMDILIDNPSVFNVVSANFCLQTIVILSWISSKIGCNIHIPSIYKGILYLIKYLKKYFY